MLALLLVGGGWTGSVAQEPEGSVPSGTVSPEGVWILAVTIHDPAVDLPLLKSLQLDVAGSDRKRNVVEIVGDAGDFARLESAGLDVVYDRPSDPDPGVNALSDYLNPAEVEAFLDQMASAYPALAQKVAYATTHEGRTAWAMKISDNVGAEEDEPVVMYVAQHHAREVMTPEIGTDIINELLTKYGTDPDITRLVDDREIWVLPNHNPDGSSYVFTDNSNWRKNRRVNGDGSFGVDPNRNYAFKWGACNGSSGSTSSDTYRGPSPESEPITGAGIATLARAQRPWLNLSYHTYSELVIHPFGCENSYSSENAVFRDFASQVGTRIEGDNPDTWYAPGTGWELLYAVDGEMNDWFYGEVGSYGLTIEANTSANGFRPDYDTWRDQTVARNRPGWLYLLERPDGPGISGNVVDACSDAPLVAVTSLDEVVFSNGEFPRESEPTFGRYYWMTLPGDYTLRVELGGYETQAIPVQVSHSRVEQDVRLVPTDSFGVASIAWIVDDAVDGDGDGMADPGETFDLYARVMSTGGAISGLTATLTSADPNVTVLDGAASYGSVAPGTTADGDGFRVQLNAATPDDAPVSLILAFSADQALCGGSETNDLRVTTGAPACPSTMEPFDTDPGWSIDNLGSGGWTFGAPSGNGGSTGPDSAFSGANVYGTNLSGAYGANGDFTITTGSYDLRGVRHAELRFAEWLDNEAGFDRARVDVSLDGGTGWTEVWSGFDYGDGWKERIIDLSGVIDREEDVRFRFNLMSDGGVQEAGWSIDDFRICGEEIPNSAGKISYLSHTIDDSNVDGGNGNGTVDEGETVRIDVRVRSNRDSESTGVEAFLTTSTPGIRIRNGYAVFPTVPVGGVADALAPAFSFEVTDASCADRAQFRLDVRWDGGQASSSFEVPIGAPAVAIVLDDDFETDLGWSVGGDATAGHWVLDDPNGVEDSQGVPVQPEDDTTPAGVQAWVTGNPRTNGKFDPGDGDVDDGTTWLQSPMFDGTNADRLTLSYQRWFTRRFAGQFDNSVFVVEVSDDGGTSWVTADFTEVDNPFWAPVSIDLRDTLAPTSTMRVRFSATEDTPTGEPLIEAAIDDPTIERERLECAPHAPPARSAPNEIGNSLLVSRDGTHVRLDWSPPAVDAGHDAASGYILYSSATAPSGFAALRWPGAEFEVLVDEALAATTAHYLIVAENAGGTSGDEPAP